MQGVGGGDPVGQRRVAADVKAQCAKSGKVVVGPVQPAVLLCRSGERHPEAAQAVTRQAQHPQRVVQRMLKGQVPVHHLQGLVGAWAWAWAC